MAEKNVYIGRVWPVWPTYVRITVGTRSEMDKFQAAWKEVMTAPASAGRRWKPEPTLAELGSRICRREWRGAGSASKEPRGGFYRPVLTASTEVEGAASWPTEVKVCAAARAASSTLPGTMPRISVAAEVMKIAISKAMDGLAKACSAVASGGANKAR